MKRLDLTGQRYGRLVASGSYADALRWVLGQDAA